MKNEILAAVREFARHPYAWPGGYPLILVMADGECLCASCARNEYRLISHSTRHHERDGWCAAGVDVHWEGEAIICAHCNAEIDSAYGPVESESNLEH